MKDDVTIDKLQEAAAEIYQCVGTLLSDAGRFDSDEALMLLDLLSWMIGNREARPNTDSLLPFASLERRPNPETQADHLAEYFQKLRFAPEHHLGGGDIRLTMAQQDEVVAICRLGRSPVEAVPVSALRELEADMHKPNAHLYLHGYWADRLSAVIRGTKT